MLVKFSTLANGVFIEYKPSDRCFRFDANGNADLTSSNPAPRWFGHCFHILQFEFV